MGNDKTILVIDDSPTVRKLAESILLKEGFSVYTAEDGDEGLQIARKAVPSVIIVDFVMPKMNGFQFCKNIRSDSILGDIPIVLITSKGEDVGRGFDEKFGIVRYLQKPFEADALIIIVKEVLEGREKELPGHSENPSKEESERAINHTAAESQAPVTENGVLSDIPFIEINTTGLTLSNVPSGEEYLADVAMKDSLYSEGADSQIEPMDAYSVNEEAKLKVPHHEYILPSDVSFVEINSVESVYAIADNKAAHVPDDQLSNAPVIEPPPDETAPVESSTAAYAAAAPENILHADDKHYESVHADVKELVEKEFRQYFGQELSVILKNTVIQALKETDLVRSTRRILSGELTYFSVANILQFISTAGLSGQLTVLTEEFNSEIYLEEGQVAFASISKPGYRNCLEELILKDGKPGRNEILAALSEARGNSLRGGNILVEKGLITDDELTGYYRKLSEAAVQQTLSASSGRFYIEDAPLPVEIRRTKMAIPSNGSRR